MQSQTRSLIGPILMTLLLICGTVCASPAPDSTVVVSRSLLREATARIDQLDWTVATLRARAAESDSVWADRLRYADARADRWESTATAWWTRHESAFWAIMGMLATALALH